MPLRLLRPAAFILVVVSGAVVTGLLVQERLDSTAIEASLAALGGLAPVGFVAAFAVGTVLFVPGSLFGLAGGVLFGPLWGALCNLLGATLGATALHGHPSDRLPNTLFLSFPGVAGARLLEALPEICASTGSACHSGSHAPCASLLAIGVPPDRAVGPVRLSLGRDTTVQEIQRAAALLAAAWRTLAPLGAKDEPVQAASR